MYMPQELEVWYVLPAIRREIALSLKKRNIPQKRIAQLLNVTEPAVSQYIKSKRASQVKFTPSLKKMIKQASENLLSNSNLIVELNKIMRQAKKQKLLCTLHKCDCKQKDCGVCYK